MNKASFLRFIAITYFIGFILHLLDIFDLRLKMSELCFTWKIWIYYLLIFDFLTALFLWRKSSIGEVLFLMVAVSQLIAYVGFKNIFGEQNFLVIFHIISVGIYILIVNKQKKFNKY